MLGCGPISQIAHFDACRKARNIDLYAICDVADDLRNKMAAVWEPQVAYRDYQQMLADPQVEAVVIGVADQFHVPLSLAALDAGKHVLVEKPLGTNIEECEQLKAAVHSSGLVLQIGNNRRFDPGIAFARDFVRDELGQRMSFKAWYYDSVYRYTMTDNLQASVTQSAGPAAGRQSQSRSPAVLRADARQPPGRHDAAARRRDRGGAGSIARAV